MKLLKNIGCIIAVPFCAVGLALGLGSVMMFMIAAIVSLNIKIKR